MLTIQILLSPIVIRQQSHYIAALLKQNNLAIQQSS
jgi:hypothetical protein